MSIDALSYDFWIRLIYLITVLFTVVTVIQQKGDPPKTISWILVIIFLPALGILLYFSIGKNYRKEKIFSRKGLSDLVRIREMATEKGIGLPRNASGARKIGAKVNIAKLLFNTEKAILSDQNRVQILNDGQATFRAILHAIETATHHIHLEYYIIENDKLGNRFRELLIRKAQEGVKVRMIYDDVGSWSLDKKFIRSLTDAGVEVYPFMPVKLWFYPLANKINYRNHRKIIVIDGEIGFVGGLNIADRYIMGSEELGRWRDTHLRLEGQAVYSLQMIFMADWHFVSKQIVEATPPYFPELNTTGECMVQVVASGPDSEWASIMQAYFTAIATAKSEVFLTSPYFIPNESILTAIKASALSGVDVRILLPAKSDSHMTYWATLSYVTELLASGVKVYLYEKGFTHSKIMMIDHSFSSVGTANIDIRSFDQNFEINALIYNEEITKELRNRFLQDLKHSKLLTLNQWQTRPRHYHIKESLARIFTPLL